MSLKQSYNGIPATEIKAFLEEKYLQYNNPSFIECDPISIPHSFSDNRDREISGFLTAAIAWGRRDLILRSSRLMLELMDNSPYEFIMAANENELLRFSRFVHRTFNGTDCIYFLRGLRHIYSNFGTMEDVVVEGIKTSGSIKEGLSNLRSTFFSLPHASRNEKHFADVTGGAAGKRLNMFTFIEGLKHLYKHKNGLEGVFVKYQTNDSLQPAIHELKRKSFLISHILREPESTCLTH